MLRTVLGRSFVSAAFGLVGVQPTTKLRLPRKIYYNLPLKYLPTGNSSQVSPRAMTYKMLIISHILLTKSGLVLRCWDRRGGKK